MFILQSSTLDLTYKICNWSGGYVCAIELDENYVDFNNPEPQATVSHLSQTQVEDPMGIPFEQTRTKDED